MKQKHGGVYAEVADLDIPSEVREVAERSRRWRCILLLSSEGICLQLASCVSDCISNMIRVLKTARQTSPTSISYRQAAEQIIAAEGLPGLLGRGLGTRLLTNAVQASLFVVVWKYLEGRVNK